MSNYRRNRVPGGTYFFTVNLRNRRSDLLVAEVDSLRTAVRRTRDRCPFHIDAWVVLPEHMHCLWTLPPGDSDYSGRWRAIKATFSRLVSGRHPPVSAPLRRNESGIWQRRFWEHTIRDDRDYAAHIDYVHFNPVKHGLVSHASEWTFSSFHRCVSIGLYPIGWAHDGSDVTKAGERC